MTARWPPGRCHRQRRRDGAGVGSGHGCGDHPFDRPHRRGAGGGGDSRTAATVVTGSDDGTVRVWDLATGSRSATRSTGHTGWVRAVATAGWTAARWPSPAATMGRCGCGIWPPAHRSATRSPATPAGCRRWRSAAGRPPGGRHRQRRWDGAGVGSGHRRADRRPLDRPHRPGVGGGGGALDGRPVAVTGSDDGTVRVWDLATGDPAATRSTGHTGGVQGGGGRRLDGRQSWSPAATTGRCGCGIWPPAPAGDPLRPATPAR